MKNESGNPTFITALNSEHIPNMKPAILGGVR